MMKKMITVFITLAFVCSSFLLMSSCTSGQKQIKASETVTAASAETEAAAEKERAAEAERQAKLRDLESLRSEVENFESQNIYFSFDKSELETEAKANLKEKAEWLNNNTSYSVNIEGHCDERGTNEYNLALGERRAHAATKFLMTLGIAEDRISTVSYGEEKPADPEHNEEAWAKNRRDEFKLSK